MTLRAMAPSGVPFSVTDILYGIQAARAGDAGCDAFRRALSDRFGAEHVFLYSSGRGAISVGLKALNALSPDRDEVVLPAFTSFSVPSAVVNAGFKVSLYDIDPDTLSPDLASLEAAITDRTLCVMVCHLFGCPADMDAVSGIAGRAGVPVFDDAAQAMGATYGGRQVGTMGDIGLFSLSRGKNISAVDGGILVTDRDDLAAELKSSAPSEVSFKDKCKTAILSLALCFLLHPRLYWIPNSLPFLRLGESHFDPQFDVTALWSFQAGLGLRMLKRLDRINTGRKTLARNWQTRLAGRRFPEPVEGADCVWLRAPLLDAGDVSELRPLGVVPSYPTGLHEIAELTIHRVGSDSFPGAERIARSIATLPTHAYVKESDMDEIVRGLSREARR